MPKHPQSEQRPAVLAGRDGAGTVLPPLLIFTLSLSTKLQLCILLPRERPPHQEKRPAAPELSQTRLTTSQILVLLFLLTHFTFLFSNLSSLPLSYLTSRSFSPFFPFTAPSLAVFPYFFAALQGKPSPLKMAAGTWQCR